VLDNFGEGVRETLEVKGLGHLWKSGPTKGSFWNFYEDWGWTFEQFKELVDWGVDYGYIFTGHWRPNAVESVRRVAALGHEIIIITDRSFGSNPLHSQRNTIEAFAQAGIEYDELIFSADKTVGDVDVMVEDKLDNYDALVAHGTPTFLINRSWNQVPGGDARIRINDVSEYADAVEFMTQRGFVDLSFA
jgi:hypothetical protein